MSFRSVPTQYASGVSGRKLTTELPQSRISRDMHVEVKYPKLSRELQAAMKLRDQKKQTVDVDELIAKAMGTGKKEADWKKKDPLEDVRDLNHYDIHSQRVHMPNASSMQNHGNSLQRTGQQNRTLSGMNLTEEEAREAMERQEVPTPGEILKPYKMYSVVPDKGEPADVEAYLNPQLRFANSLSRPMAPGSVVAQSRQQMEASGTFQTLAPHRDSIRAGTLAPGTGSLSKAIQQNRMGSTSLGTVEVPRGGSGLVVGEVHVEHDYLIAASLVASKWGRVVHTTYAQSRYEPCRLKTELQPIYYESFIQDLKTATQGRADFVSDVAPAVFLVNIGTVNAAVHGHRPSNVAPEPIQLEMDDRVWDDELEGSSGSDEDDEEEDDEEGKIINTKVVGGFQVNTRKKKKKKRRGKKGTALGMADLVNPVSTGRELVVDEARAAARMRGPRKPPPLSEDDIKKAEIRLLIETGQEQANRIMFQLARDGDSVQLARLITKGHRVEYNPNPWYTREIDETKRKKEEERERAEAERQAKEKGLTSALTGRYDHTTNTTGGATEGGNDQRREGVFVKKKKQEANPELFIPPEIDATDDAGNTALMMAARRGWIDVVSLLLRHGADWKRKNTTGQTALDLAKMESSMASVALAGGIPGAADRKRRAAKLVQMLDDRTVLVCAQQGDQRRLEYLVETEKHPVNVANQYGMTPLHFATMRKDLAMISYLVQHGAPVDARNNLGQSPLSLAYDEVNKAEQEAMLKAMSLGEEWTRQEMERKRTKADTEKKLLSQEQYLARQLKTATKGTTAAKAVHVALGGSKFPNFGPIPGLKDETRKEDAVSANMQILMNKTKRNTLKSDDLQETAELRLLKGGKRVTIDGKVKPLSTADRVKTQHDLQGLSTSWSRHVLDYINAQHKTAKVVDNTRSRLALEHSNLASSARMRHDHLQEQRNQGLRTGGLGETFSIPDKERTMAGTASNAANMLRSPKVAGSSEKMVSDLYRKVVTNPTAVDETTMRLEPPPNPDSGRFEAWARMRFGAI